MTNTNTAANISNSQIDAFMNEAGTHGDAKGYAIAYRALNSASISRRAEMRALCAEMIVS